MSVPADKIIEKAYALAEAKGAHAVAVYKFGHDIGEYSEVERTSKAWTKADAALRKAVEKAQS